MKNYVKMLIFTLAAFLLSGCVKLNIDLQVSTNDTVSGDAIIALSDALAGLADTNSETFGEGLYSEGDGIRQIAYSEGGFTGTQIFFQGVPLEIFSQNSSEDDFIKIVRDGDNLITTGNFNLADEGVNQDDAEVLGGDFIEEIFSSADISISISYPGEIIETNGNVEGNTITWSPEYGSKNEIRAVVKAPQTPPLLQYFVIGTIAITLFLISVFVIRKNSKKGGTHEPS